MNLLRGTILSVSVFLMLASPQCRSTIEATLPTATATSAYLPMVLSDSALARVQPADFEYVGAFRLPAGGDRPYTFAYGGSALTYNPDGDPTGPDDGYPGTLFIMGHDRLPYGELPNGNQVAEIQIPLPVQSADPGDLNTAGFVQDFHDIAAGYFTTMDELPRTGMQYLNHAATGPAIHLAWGQHFEPDPPAATHAWFSPDLAAPDLVGTWFIGSQSFYSVNGYLLEIPAGWADIHTQGRYLGTGRFRDGGWSGMGPALFAYLPWTSALGTPAAAGAHLPATTLLLYQSSDQTEQVEHSLNGYQHPDEWEGAAWITTSSNKAGVLFAGTKSNGAKYWYGFSNPAGPDLPCVEEELVGQFPLCRMADGSHCPPADLVECPGHNDYRGWWSTHFDAQFILYDPADLARVAAGELDSWEPQPYAVLDIDEHLYLNPAGVETDMLGTGDQRRYRIGDITYDRARSLLYVLELFADDAQPVVHVWRIR